MERGIMLQPDVVELLRQMDRLEIFTDNALEGEYKRIQKEITGYNAQPTFIILDSKHHREVTRSSFTNSAEEFKRFLKEGLTDRPAFQSRLQIGKLVPLDGQLEKPVELNEVGTLETSPGVPITYLGKSALAYNAGFEVSRGLRLPSDLPPGNYRLDAKLETSLYVGDEWRTAYSLRVRLPLSVE